jgi:hypothetical protein
MFRLLPRKIVTLHSSLACEEALKKLLSSLLPLQKRTGGISFTSEVKFQGKVEGNRFNMRRQTGYRNDLLPLAKGLILPEGSECVIKLDIKIPGRSAMIMLILSILILGGIFRHLFIKLTPENMGGLFLAGFIPISICIFFIEIMRSNFNREAAKAENYLCEILHATVK